MVSAVLGVSRHLIPELHAVQLPDNQRGGRQECFLLSDTKHTGNCSPDATGQLKAGPPD